MFEKLKKRGFKVLALHHAEAIITHDMAETIDELTSILDQVSIPVEELVRGGGGEADFTQRLRKSFAELKWNKHNFIIGKTIDGVPTESLSHEIDHVRKLNNGWSFALEIEWNNKDPFFDRDLENFKRLHAEGAISVGGIITRGESMQDSMRATFEAFAKKAGIKSAGDVFKYYEPRKRQLAMYENSAKRLGSFEAGWAHAFVADKFGEATTHWRKLEERVGRGVGNPCPLVLVGLPASVIKL